jgi:ascorbate-specific PTS system EIIC-type component UlaA
MSEILEVVSTIFVSVILFAGALLIGMVAIVGLGILWKELRTTFKQRRTKELPREKQGKKNGVAS